MIAGTTLAVLGLVRARDAEQRALLEARTANEIAAPSAGLISPGGREQLVHHVALLRERGQEARGEALQRQLSALPDPSSK